MVGCRDGAKNTLVKNYLWLAERLGVRIEPLRTVVDIRPLDPARPEAGYAVTHERTGAWVRRDRQTISAAQVVVAAGAWGTGSLLQELRLTGSLPALSDALGDRTRPTSEALGGAMAMKAPQDADLTRGIAITTSFHVDDVTHVENCRYGKGSNLMGALATLMVEDDPTLPAPGAGRARWRRPVQFAREVARQPKAFGRTLVLRKWSERTAVSYTHLTLPTSDLV